MKTLVRVESREYRGLVLFGLCALLTGAFTAEPAAGQTTARLPEPLIVVDEEAVDRVRDRIRTWMDEKNLPGVSIAVGVDGQIVWAEGFGWADLEQRVPVTPLTRFRIGSASKGLTSAAVGLLHERGALDLDSPVRAYLPSFPEKKWPMSTRQLMGHVAGVRHYVKEDEALREKEIYSSRHYDTVLESLEIFAADPLLFRPGTKYSYSGFGYSLVSAVVERVAGESFLEFMRREIFATLGMRHTVPDDVFRIVPHRASSYVRDSDGRLQNERYVDQSNIWAAGGFLSTPSDLVRFGFGMLEAEVLKPETVEMLWTSPKLESGGTTGYGLGWFLSKKNGHRVVASPGSSIGGRCSFVIFPDDSLVVAIMSNVTDAEVAPIWQALAQTFIKKGK